MKGDLRILSIDSGGGFVEIACLTDNSMSETADMLDTTTRDNEGWRTYRPGAQTGSIDFSGVLETSGSLTFDGLRVLARAGTLIDWKVSSTEGGDTYSGEGYISSLSEEASVESFVTFSGSIQISGDITTT
jgi:predicted secreted protein